MSRSWRRELRPYKCWDRTTEALFQEHGEPLEDCILQNREELIGLCRFMEQHNVRSYLEIGVWTGALVRALHSLFSFELVAACDHGWARRKGLPITMPPGARFLEGGSEGREYLRWRESLGPVDLVLIDANHNYNAVRRDFEINRAFPHRFLALHDITGASRHTVGVGRLWRELEGTKHEILEPHAELGLDHSIMGIGIWQEG